MNAPTIPELRDLLNFLRVATAPASDEVPRPFQILSEVIDELSDLRQLRTTNDELRRHLAAHEELLHRRRNQIIALGGLP